jgi:hypothetical protein
VAQWGQFVCIASRLQPVGEIVVCRLVNIVGLKIGSYSDKEGERSYIGSDGANKLSGITSLASIQ